MAKAVIFNKAYAGFKKGERCEKLSYMLAHKLVRNKIAKFPKDKAEDLI